MKYVQNIFILFFAIFFSLFLKGQGTFPVPSTGGGLPNKQFLGTDSTLVGNRGIFWSKFGDVYGIFTDTAAANLTRIKQYAAATIFTSDNQTTWVRNMDANKWVTGSQAGGGGGGGNTIIDGNTLIICNGQGVCDTLTIGDDIFNFYFINNGSQVVICSQPSDTCTTSPDTCYSITHCDTFDVNFPQLVFQSGVGRKNNGDIVELGEYLGIGNVITWINHPTELNTFLSPFVIGGEQVWNPPLNIYQKQSPQVSTDILTLRNDGSEQPGQLDIINRTLLHFGSTIAKYANDINHGFFQNYIGKYIGNNFVGRSSYGIGIDDPNAKLGWILFHDYDTTNNKVVTLGGYRPNLSNILFNAPLIVDSANLIRTEILSLKYDKSIQAYGYGSASNFINSDSTNKPLMVDANGNIYRGAYWFGSASSDIPTLDQVLAASVVGGVVPVTSDYTIDMLSDILTIKTLEAINFISDDGVSATSTLSLQDPLNILIQSVNGADTSYILQNANGIRFHNDNGTYLFDNLLNDNSKDNIVVWDATNRVLRYRTASSLVPTYTGSNGLTLSANDFKLGGTLTANTTIAAGSSFVLNLTGTTSNPNYIFNATGAANGIYTTGTNVPFQADLTRTDALNSIARIMVLKRIPSSGTPLNGIGVSVDFESLNGSSVNKLIGQIVNRYTDVTSGSEDAAFDFKLMAAGATASTIATIDGSGVVGIGISSSFNSTRLDIVDNSVGAASIVNISTTSTAAASNLQKALNISLSGANATSDQQTYGVYVSNTHTGTNPNNTGVYSTVSGIAPSISGNNTSTGYGIYGSSTSIAIAGSSSGSYAGYFLGTSRTNNAVAALLTLDNTSTGTPASGFGSSIQFQSWVDNLNTRVSNTLVSKWTTITDAGRISQFIITGVNSAVTGDIISFEGNKRTMLYGRLEQQQGADVASAAGAIAVGLDGNSFEITGTATITLISNLNWVNGSEVTLIFTSTATLTDGTANSGTDIGMELAGNTNFVASAGATIKLLLSEIGGTQRWRETSRSVN